MSLTIDYQHGGPRTETGAAPPPRVLVEIYDDVAGESVGVRVPVSEFIAAAAPVLKACNAPAEKASYMAQLQAAHSERDEARRAVANLQSRHQRLKAQRDTLESERDLLKALVKEAMQHATDY